MGIMTGKRVLLTQADDFMGPYLAERFAAEGADLVVDRRDLTAPGAVEALVERTGTIDVLLANLAVANPRTSVQTTEDSTFRQVYEGLVFPLHRLVRAVIPQMLDRRSGKIVVIGSATALKGMPNFSAYGSARGAQLSYVQDAGIEVAPDNVQINLIAQTFVESGTYFPKSYQESEEFAERMKGVPAGRLAHGWESAALALFLASNESDFLVGQAVPFGGGWV